MPALLKQVRAHFDTLSDHRRAGVNYSLSDVLMSALAMFSLKDGSLLSFDQQRQDPIRQQNLHNLFGVANAPCDSQMRAALDPVKPSALRPAFKMLHQMLQQQGVLADYRFMGKYLISVDGTGLFSSSKIRCPECCVKNHKDGTQSFYHQLVAAVMVHPDRPTVLPFYPEAITRRDGDNKNDCEHNAAKRLIRALCQDFPQMQMILLQDALACNGPHIRLLQQQGASFIITAKPRANSLLLTQLLNGLDNGRSQEV